MKNARIEVANEMKVNPLNIMPIVLADYGDFFDLFFNEDISKYEKLKENKELRLNSIALCTDNSAYYLFSKAQIYFHWSLIKIKYKEYFGAAFDLRKAYLLFKECKKKYPSFTTADVYIGTIESIAGTIPDSYKWVSNLLGISSNLLGGSAAVANYTKTTSNLFYTDALFLDTYIKQYLLNAPDEAWTNIDNHKSGFSKNKLLCFMGANIALNQHKSKLAITFLNQLNPKIDFLDMPIVYYELGCAYMYNLEKDKANQNLEKYISQFKGKFYIKDAYYKLCLIAYLYDYMPNAKKYQKNILSTGNTESDADKKALEFAKANIFPNKQLLKARLLFDGGAFTESFAILNVINTKSLLQTAELLEYYYRKGRIAHLQMNEEEAIKNYSIAMDKGRTHTAYFAARSALYMGQLYEDKKDKNNAIRYYSECLAMKNHEYKSSIDQMAKSGLLRLNKK